MTIDIFFSEINEKIIQSNAPSGILVISGLLVNETNCKSLCKHMSSLNRAERQFIIRNQ